MWMCQAAKVSVWPNGLLEDLYIELRTSLITYGDNQGALVLALNSDSHPRSTHVDIKYHFTRKIAQAARIAVMYLPTKLVIADLLTRPIPRRQFDTLTEGMGVY